MTAITPADFTWQFPHRTNPHAQRLHDHVLTWAGEVGLITTESGRRRFERVRMDQAAAHLAPTIKWEGLSTLVCWLEWLARMDDQVDDAPIRRQPRLLATILRELRAVLATGTAPRPSPAGDTLAYLWQHIRSSTPAAWQHRFLGHLDELFDGYLWEATYRRIGTPPDETTCIELRRRTSCMAVVCDLVDHFKGLRPPEGFYTSPVYQTLRNAAIDVIQCANDVFSYAKESIHGETSNLLAATTGTSGRTPQQAVSDLRRRSDEQLALFTRLTTELPKILRAHGAGEQAVESAVACARTVQDVMHGSINWYPTTGRYRPEGEEEADFSYLTEQEFFDLKTLPNT